MLATNEKEKFTSDIVARHGYGVVERPAHHQTPVRQPRDRPPYMRAPICATKMNVIILDQKPCLLTARS